MTSVRAELARAGSPHPDVDEKRDAFIGHVLFDLFLASVKAADGTPQPAVMSSSIPSAPVRTICG